MSNNEQLITMFYQSFQNKDFKAMQACYADNATFSDPVFTNLNAAQVRSMWEMFCVKGKDLRVEFSKVHANETHGSAEWKASYTFSATGKKVINHITANFLFENGRILRHTDTFDFYAWANQALGVTGKLFGWTSLIQNKVREKAMRNLTDYMNKK